MVKLTKKDKLKKAILASRKGLYALTLSDFSDIIECVFSREQLLILSKHLESRGKIKEEKFD